MLWKNNLPQIYREIKRKEREQRRFDKILYRSYVESGLEPPEDLKERVNREYKENTLLMRCP